MLVLTLPISLSSHLAQPIATITAIYLKLSEGFNSTYPNAAPASDGSSLSFGTAAA